MVPKNSNRPAALRWLAAAAMSVALLGGTSGLAYAQGGHGGGSHGGGGHGGGAPHGGGFRGGGYRGGWGHGGGWGHYGGGWGWRGGWYGPTIGLGYAPCYYAPYYYPAAPYCQPYYGWPGY